MIEARSLTKVFGGKVHHHAGLSPGAAVAGLAGWVLVLAAAAALSLRVRDA